MPKAYDPEPVEGRWYAVWEEAGSFRPEANESGEPFCIVIPPPNVTGSLHMGHAFEHSLIDATIRRKRMQGYAALWLPGTDHAGIATQNVVERELAKEGLDRHEIGRDGFVERVWEWKGEQGGRITQQMRKMGSSCDWTQGAVHDGRGLLPGRPRRVRAALRRGPHLPGQPDHQLVPPLPHRPVRHRGRARGRRRRARPHPLPVRRRRRVGQRGHHPGRDDARRHRAWPCIPTTSATPPPSAAR